MTHASLMLIKNLFKNQRWSFLEVFVFLSHLLCRVINYSLQGLKFSCN